MVMMLPSPCSVIGMLDVSAPAPLSLPSHATQHEWFVSCRVRQWRSWVHHSPTYSNLHPTHRIQHHPCGHEWSNRTERWQSNHSDEATVDVMELHTMTRMMEWHGAVPLMMHHDWQLLVILLHSATPSLSSSLTHSAHPIVYITVLHPYSVSMVVVYIAACRGFRHSPRYSHTMLHPVVAWRCAIGLISLVNHLSVSVRVNQCEML